MVKKPDSVSKEDFITLLADMTPEDVNNLIRNKGKGPKVIPLGRFINDNKKIPIKPTDKS